MKYALIDLSENTVVNIVEIEPGDGSQTPDGFQAVQSDAAAIGDGWDGSALVPQVQAIEINGTYVPASEVKTVGGLETVTPVSREEFDALATRVSELAAKIGV